jgi:hypothetical protein
MKDFATFSFRLRHGYAPTAFLSSLRLRSTFPFAKPQAEAKLRQDQFTLSTERFAENY